MTENKLLRMLMNEPDLYDVINSKQHIYVLKLLTKSSYNIQNIKKEIPKDLNIKKDAILYNILDILVKKELITKINVNNTEMYYISDKGRDLITQFEITQKQFRV